METLQKEFASMSEVVMKKDELLKKLVENKAKHDVILANAIAGYWELAKEKLEARRITFLKTVTDYQEDINKEVSRISAKIENKEELPAYLSLKAFAIDLSLGLIYPQDHSQDYDRAIRMMEASIYDEVKLSVDEFDAYVLNNWEWKKNFLATNVGYVNSMRMKYKKLSAPVGREGSQGSFGTQYDGLYKDATVTAQNLFAASGCGPSNF